MKLWFSLALLVLPLLSCGQRNASGSTQEPPPDFQKPESNRSWFILDEAEVLNDHQIRLGLIAESLYFPTEKYEIFVDEKEKSLVSYSQDQKIEFASMTCVSEIQGNCQVYEIKNSLGLNIRVQREGQLRITEKTAMGTKTYLKPMVFLNQKESGGWDDFVFTDFPSGSSAYWLTGILSLPGFTFGLKPLTFALAVNLSDPFNLYEYRYANQIIDVDHTTYWVVYRHRLTGKEEKVEWDIRRE